MPKPIINPTTFTRYKATKDSRHQFGAIKIDFDTSKLNEELIKLGTTLQATTNNTTIMTEMAKQVVKMSADLVPYRNVYYLRKTNRVKDRKTGKDKLVHDYYKQMYNYDLIGGRQQRMYWQESSTYYPGPVFKEVQNDKGKWVKTNKLIGGYYAIGTPTKLALNDPRTRGVRLPVKIETGITSRIKPKKYKHGKHPKTNLSNPMFRPDTENPYSQIKTIKHFEDEAVKVKTKPKFSREFESRAREYLQTQTTKGEQQVYKELLGVAKKGQPYTDRPPHLQDSYKFIKTADGRVGIKYSVKKAPNKHFVGGVQTENYADRQYYSKDYKWKRFTDDTSSRWLEIALGLDVPETAMSGKYPEGAKNYNKLIKYMKSEVKKSISKGK